MLFHIFSSWIVAYPKNFIGECIQNLVHDGRSFPAVLVSRRGEGEILTGELFMPASLESIFKLLVIAGNPRRSPLTPLEKGGKSYS